MSARFYDAGSGPHDASSTINERGERNCGCRHDGRQWLSLCATAQLALAEYHCAGNAAIDRPEPGERV